MKNLLTEATVAVISAEELREKMMAQGMLAMAQAEVPAQASSARPQQAAA